MSTVFFIFIPFFLFFSKTTIFDKLFIIYLLLSFILSIIISVVLKLFFLWGNEMFSIDKTLIKKVLKVLLVCVCLAALIFAASFIKSNNQNENVKSTVQIIKDTNSESSTISSNPNKTDNSSVKEKSKSTTKPKIEKQKNSKSETSEQQAFEYFSTSDGIYKKNIETSQVTKIYNGAIQFFHFAENNFFFLEGECVVKADVELKTKHILFVSPNCKFLNIRNYKIELIDNQDYYICYDFSGKELFEKSLSQKNYAVFGDDVYFLDTYLFKFNGISKIKLTNFSVTELFSNENLLIFKSSNIIYKSLSQDFSPETIIDNASYNNSCSISIFKNELYYLGESDYLYKYNIITAQKTLVLGQKCFSLDIIDNKLSFFANPKNPFGLNEHYQIDENQKLIKLT